MTVQPHAFGVGLFTDFATFDIPVGVDLVRTSGHTAAGLGDALYASVAAGPATPWRVQDANGRWFELSDELITPQMFGAVGDGVTDDTAAFQDALDASEGKAMFVPGGQIFIISTPLDLPDGLSLFGAGVLRAVDEDPVGRWLLQATSKADISIEGITLDSVLRVQDGVQMVRWGGIFLDECERVRVARVRIRDTVMTGIKIRNVIGGQVIDNTLTAAGADFDDEPNGGQQNADDHGILICAQEEGETRSIVVSGNIINGAGATRKGITTFASPRVQASPLTYFPSKVSDLTISANCVWDCRLGGIFVANSPTNALRQEALTITGNTCWDNYVNLQVSGVRSATVTANVLHNAVIGQSVVVSDAHYSTFVGNQVLKASSHGMRIFDSTFLALETNVVLEANSANGGFGCGILFQNVTDSKVTQNLVADPNGLMTYGYYEGDGSARNVLRGNDIRNSTAGNYTLDASSYRLDTRVVSTTYDPPNIAAGASASTTVTVSGAALGEAVFASWSASLQGLILTTAINASGQVTATFSNPTGSAINLASGTLRLWIATP